MAAQDEGEKEFEPSQRKLDDARKKGDTPKSQDLSVAASYGGILLAATAFGAATVQAMGADLSSLLGQSVQLSDVLFGGGGASTIMGGVMWRAAVAIAPWFVIPAGLVILTLIAQQAIIFAPDKIQPKLNRISPISGIKNKFGRSGLFEFAKSFVKLLLYSTILGFYLYHELPSLMVTMAMSPGQIGIELGEFLVGIMLIVLVVALSLGVVDYMFQRAEHTRKLRMTRKEMTDEMKESEGDPHMKQERRQRGMEMALNQMLGDVPEADVVIVNPTHYAVALKWDKLSGRAPTCVAKGVDEVALRIRERAAEAGVPIHADPPTARALHATVEIGQDIEREQYKAVAAAIRFAEAMRKKAKARGW